MQDVKKMSSILAKRNAGCLRSIVWKRDIRLIVHPDAKARLADFATSADNEQVKESDLYILPHTGLACAILPRGINMAEAGRFYGYASFLKSFVAKRCTQNNGIFMVILRGVYDIITAETILCMKKEYKEVRLICVEPYDGYFLKLPSKMRERYLQIINSADEVHHYDQDNKIGEAEQYALAHADALLFIQSEETNTVWQKLLDNIWFDLRKDDGFMYDITRLWIIHMEWILQKVDYDPISLSYLFFDQQNNS